jgi:hypothetical protein
MTKPQCDWLGVDLDPQGPLVCPTLNHGDSILAAAPLSRIMDLHGTRLRHPEVAR